MLASFSGVTLLSETGSQATKHEGDQKDNQVVPEFPTI